MKKQKSIERGITFKAAAVYAIVIISGVALFLYMLGLRDSMSSQKMDMEHSRHTLALTNELVLRVNRVQSDAGLYIASGREKHLADYKKEMKGISAVVDSLKSLTEDAEIIELLYKINILLVKKMDIVSQLNIQFSKANPVEVINQSLKNWPTEHPRDSVFIFLERKDSVVQVDTKKTFFKRLSEAFNPKKAVDSTIVISSMATDTTYIAGVDTLNIVSQVDSAAKAASQAWLENLNSIENQIVKLLTVEEDISRELSTILLQLHNRALVSTMKEIQASEETLKKNYNYSVSGIILSLLLTLLFILMIISDVHKGYRARKELEKANALTRRIMDSRHRLLLSVTHDIKTPLGSILGYLELCDGKEKQLNSEQLSSMRNSGQYILSMLENLLEFSALEKGSITVSESDFSLSELLCGILDMFSPLAARKGLNLETDFNLSDAEIVHSDSLKIKQIIVNLISNAIKYTSKGSVSLEVSYVKEALLSVKVSDTGVGIPKDKLDSIFNPFFRVQENSPLSEGNGFGMFVVKGLVELLGGTIGIDSEADCGTQVLVCLPMPRAAILLPSAENLKNNKGPKKILVVDDNPQYLSMVGEMLGSMGHNVVLCNSREEFCLLLKGENLYDFILTDMDMTSFTGEDVLKEIKETGSISKVVIMTAHGDFTMEKAISSGFDNYLKKPFTVADAAIVFGGGKKEEKRVKHPLKDIFGDDAEQIANVLEAFRQANIEHLSKLRKALSENDMSSAQFECHKMYPMFAQLGAAEIAEILLKMDSSRGKRPEQYPRWREDTEKIISSVEGFNYSFIP